MNTTKLTLLAIFLVTSFLLHAQDEETFKPTGGDKTLEVQFSPFGSTPVSINGIRLRKFSSDQTAFRLHVFLGASSETVITQQADGPGTPELNDRFSTLAINVRPGYEKHLEGTERLSPYFGAEVDLAVQFSSDRSEFESGANNIETSTTTNQNGFFRIGGNLIAGMDYYIAKRVYLGTEIGFGLAYTQLLNVKFENSLLDNNPDPSKRGGRFDMGPNVNAEIRFGYAF